MGKAPSSPNPVTTANAQTASNVETAVAQTGLNSINQITPNGTLTYDQIGTWSDGTPRFQATTALSGAGQELLNTTNATSQNLANVARAQSGRLGEMLNKPLDFSGVAPGGVAPKIGEGPKLQTQIANAGAIQKSLGPDDFSADRARVEEGLFSRLNPQVDQQRQAFETSLINRGIRPGTTAYDQQMGQFQQGVNDQRTSILLQGGQEQSRLQGMALNAGNFVNSAQAQQYGQNANNGTFSNNAMQQMYNNQVNAQQANFNNQNTQRSNSLNELLTQRSVPLNELLAVAGQGQVQMPQFASSPSTGVAGTDVAGITQAGYANQMGAYNSNQGMLGGLFSAGASLLPLLSDRRAKTDIVRIGATDAGTPIYKFRYKTGGPVQIGYMAQDLLETQPHAVSMGPDGLYRVQYDEVA